MWNVKIWIDHLGENSMKLKSGMTRKLLVCVAMLGLFSLAACAETITAADGVTDPTFAPMAHNTQFFQQATGTQIVQNATKSALELSARQTADVSTVVAQQILQTQSSAERNAKATSAAIAISDASTQSARVTEQAFAPTQTYQAGDNATETQRAAFRVNATGTARVESQLSYSATAAARSTDVMLANVEAEGERVRVVNGFISALEIGASLLTGLIALRLAQVIVVNLRKRGMVQPHGKNGSQALAIVEDGTGGIVILNPTTPGHYTHVRDGQVETAPMTPEVFALLQGGQQVAAIEAEHSPFAPAKPEQAKRERRKWNIGPVGAETETTVAPQVLLVPPVELQSPKTQVLAAPETNIQWGWIDAHTSEADRDKCDMREMIERGAVIGFSRADWINHKFASGHDGGRERYDDMIRVLVAGKKIVREKNAWRLTGNVRDIVASMNLENYGPPTPPSLLQDG